LALAEFPDQQETPAALMMRWIEYLLPKRLFYMKFSRYLGKHQQV
jgi:hypothetical protein